MGLLLPCVTSICLTSDSELLVQLVCNLDSRTGPGTNQTFILGLGGIGVVQSCEAPLISVVSHSVRDDTFESTGSVGVGGVKQTVRSWVWEARRQTERFLPIHTLRWGLV